MNDFIVIRHRKVPYMSSSSVFEWDTNCFVGEMQKHRKLSSLSTISSLKSASPRGEEENSTFIENPCDEDSDVNLLYVDRIENMKRILFPATNDFTQLSPRARLCIARVEEELFELRRQRNEILRRESELIYTLHDTLLEEECDKLRADMAKLSQIPEERKSAEQWQEEEELLQQIVSIVNKRNVLLLDLHIERLREQEEDEELNEEYQTHKAEWLKLVGDIEETKAIKHAIKKHLAVWLEHMSKTFHLAARKYTFD